MDLNLSHNKISDLSGVAWIQLGQSLRSLNLSSNRVTDIRPLGTGFFHLFELKLCGNIVKDLEGVKLLKFYRFLAELDLSNNQVRELPFYRSIVLYSLPMLKSLDGQSVEAEEVINARSLHGDYKKQMEDIWYSVNPGHPYEDHTNLVGN